MMICRHVFVGLIVYLTSDFAFYEIKLLFYLFYLNACTDNYMLVNYSHMKI